MEYWLEQQSEPSTTVEARGHQSIQGPKASCSSCAIGLARWQRSFGIDYHGTDTCRLRADSTHLYKEVQMLRILQADIATTDHSLVEASSPSQLIEGPRGSRCLLSSM